MSEYLELVKPTYIENWPKELCSLSIGQVGIKLSLKEAEILCSNNLELNECFDFPKFQNADEIIKKIDQEIIKFPKGAFVRLGSRSPKDCLYPSKDKCFTGKDAFQRLTACSERISDDLSLAINNEYEPYIWLREWKEIPEWAEFRCFMKDRKLIGISQYNYLQNKIYPEIEQYKATILSLISGFFDHFKKVSYLNNVIFDIFIQLKIIDNLYYWEIKLLEINPFFELTDPCLFDWRKLEEFKGQFLFNNSLNKYTSVMI